MSLGKKLAFDCTYSDKMIGKMAKAGYQIVCVARPGETDESWFMRAVESGADTVVSRDNDLVKLMVKFNVKNIQIVNDQKGIVINSEETDILKELKNG